MAFTDLPAAWQTELNTYHKIPKPVIEVIIDPDDMAITLTGFYGIKTLSALIDSVDISPERIGTLELIDLRAIFNDPNGFFNPYSRRDGKYQPFRNITRILFQSTLSSGEARFICEHYNGEFKAGDLVTFTDGEHTDTVKVTEMGYRFDLPGASLKQTPYIKYVNTLTHTYLENEWVSTQSVSGLDILVRLRLDGIDERFDLFRGVMRNPFEWQVGQATLAINNRLGEFLKKDIKLHASSDNPTERLTNVNTLSTSLTWNTGSIGTCSGVTTYTGAQIGEWVVTFSDNTNFTVNGLNCKDKAGTTGANFFDQTDATDSQIQIPSVNWGGTRATDDTLTFYISANFEGKTVPEIIYELLSDYADIADEFIDVGGTGVTDGSAASTNSFNKAHALNSTEGISISFDQPITIGEAVITVGAHAMTYLTQMTGGKFRLFVLSPRFYFPNYGHAVNRVIQTQNSRTEYINEFIINYGWDYVNGEYQYSLTYPPDNDHNPSYQYFGKKRTQVIELPGVYGSTLATKIAKRYYFVWYMGVSTIKVSGSLYFVNINVGDLIADIPVGYDDRFGYAGGRIDGVVFSVAKSFVNQNKVDLVVWVHGKDYDSIW